MAINTCGSLPIVVLFGLLAGLKVKPHWCAIAGAFTAALVALLVFKMPLQLAAASFAYGVAWDSEDCLDRFWGCECYAAIAPTIRGS